MVVSSGSHRYRAEQYVTPFKTVFSFKMVFSAIFFALTPMLYQVSVAVGHRVLGRTDPDLAARYGQQD